MLLGLLSKLLYLGDAKAVQFDCLLLTSNHLVVSLGALMVSANVRINGARVKYQLILKLILAADKV